MKLIARWCGPAIVSYDVLGVREMSIQHRDLTSPGYDTQPPILLLAPNIQVTPALTALTALTAPTYLTVLTALTV